jgi:hypothetical protein
VPVTSTSPTGGQLHVALNPLSAPRRTRALAAIRELLNDTETVYPGTSLVLTYTVKPHPALHELPHGTKSSGISSRGHLCPTQWRVQGGTPAAGVHFLVGPL